MIAKLNTLVAFLFLNLVCLADDVAAPPPVLDQLMLESERQAMWSEAYSKLVYDVDWLKEAIDPDMTDAERLVILNREFAVKSSLIREYGALVTAAGKRLNELRADARMTGKQYGRYERTGHRERIMRYRGGK